jgi:hypothetical protein
MLDGYAAGVELLLLEIGVSLFSSMLDGYAAGVELLLLEIGVSLFSSMLDGYAADAVLVLLCVVGTMVLAVEAATTVNFLSLYKIFNTSPITLQSFPFKFIRSMPSLRSVPEKILLGSIVATRMTCRPPNNGSTVMVIPISVYFLFLTTTIVTQLQANGVDNNDVEVGVNVLGCVVPFLVNHALDIQLVHEG